MPAHEEDKGALPLEPGAAVEQLNGVGPSRARILRQAGLGSLGALCQKAPRELIEWPAVLERGPLPPAGRVRVLGRVIEARLLRLRGRQSSVRVRLALAGSGDEVQAVFWNQPWMKERFGAGRLVELCGLVHEGRSGPELLQPMVGHAEEPLPAPGTLQPVYDPPEGIGAAVLAALCQEASRRAGRSLVDPLSAAILARADLPDLATAVAEIHSPRSRIAWEAARRRLALTPLLALQGQLAVQRAGGSERNARPLRLSPSKEKELLARLPFVPTPDQRSAWTVLRRELSQSRPMRRLLQGDVGTGKTLVAALAAMAVVEAGGQVAFLAPTELLVEQHAMGLSALLEGAGITSAVLTGSRRGEEREQILRGLREGEIGVVFGTHALFQKEVAFRRLDLAIIDEQQRFGVGQRASLLDKGNGVHLLLMTATPIPRTLAMTLYADLEVVTLREPPPGRGQIRTSWVRGARLKKMIPWIEERLREGQQVYWVCPLIGEEGEDRPGTAEERHGRIQQDERLNLAGVELVHGRIPAEERSFRLERFRRGDVGLLVATTVIEVGVDVPSATVMVIEGAERLGLAQLHQLRGRVGRGKQDSWCFLIGQRSGAARFQLLEQTRDGFEIAEADLLQRGMGDLVGLRQAGVNQEGLCEGGRDQDLLLLAREICQADPALAQSLAQGAGPRLTP